MRRVLLVLPHSMEACNNTGITIKNIFSLYPKDKLAEVCFSSLDKLDLENRIRFFEFNQRKRNNLIENFLYIQRCKKDVKFNRFIEDFQPEIIYCVCTTFQTAIISKYISNKFRIPVLIHHFDNVLETGRLRWLLRIYYDSIGKKMCKGLVISQDMKMHYEQKFKKQFEVLMNCVKHKEKYTYENTGIIMYAGGVHLDRIKSLLDVEHCIEKLNNEFNCNYKLVIYSNISEKGKQQFNQNLTCFNAPVTHDEIIKKYEEAEILLHAESFQKENFKFLKYSLTTKLPEYLISGIPILCYAPQESSIYKFIKNNNCGFFASDHKTLEVELRRVLTKNNIRNTYINNAYSLAVTSFLDDRANRILVDIIEENIMNYKNKGVIK